MQVSSGISPGKLWDMEAPHGLSSAVGALGSDPEASETGLRLRLHAKESILRNITEECISTAESTRVQPYKKEGLKKLTDGSGAHLWREPQSKDVPGWRGPVAVVKLYGGRNKVIVERRGLPRLVPIRHLRPHVGFCVGYYRSFLIATTWSTQPNKSNTSNH